MYSTIGGILLVLWSFGMVFGYTMGGAIYLVLAAAIVMLFLALRQWWQRPQNP